MHQIVSGEEIGKHDLLLLPESTGYGAISLDGTFFIGKPREVHSNIDDWTAVMKEVIGKRDILVILGMDTFEAAANSAS